MNYKSSLISGTCIAALALCAPLTASARTKKSASPSPAPSASPAATVAASPSAKPSASASNVRAIPFHGVVSAADQKAKTFTIAGKEKSRTFKVTDRSVVTKSGAPATIKDIVQNEEIRGSYWKVTDGTLEAKTVKLGPLTPAEKAAEDARKSKRAQKKAAASPTASPAASPSATP